MRPLRRSGPEADVLWNERTILLRRSQTRGPEVMGTTKTGDDFMVGVPQEVIDVLDWHVANLPHRLKVSTDLLFPPRRKGSLRSDGKGRRQRSTGFLSMTFLTKPFTEVAQACGIDKHLTAKAMRRTAIDLQRATSMTGAVRAAVGGHQTEKARKLYETVLPEETRAELAKVVSLADWKNAPRVAVG